MGFHQVVVVSPKGSPDLKKMIYQESHQEDVGSHQNSALKPLLIEKHPAKGGPHRMRAVRGAIDFERGEWHMIQNFIP